jgi:superfamily II DNA or RNA helicase
MPLYPDQQKALDDVRAAFGSGHRAVILRAPTSFGKCLGKGTPVLMFDGNVKPVEDIVMGDLLMGPDSRPRVVISTTSGFSKLYEVTQMQGDPYVVNEHHILSLKTTKMNLQPKGKVVNINVEDFVKSSEWFKHTHKGWKCGIDFYNNNDIPLDPYFFGVWLGDGDSHTTAVTTGDREIENCVRSIAEKFGARFFTKKNSENSHRCVIANPRGVGNPVLRILQKMRVIKNKHIPIEYLTSSRENRLQLLAGILDTDAECANDGYNIYQKSEKLMDGIIYLARSLGFSASKRIAKKRCTNNGVERNYFMSRICSGNETIPTRIPRKKSPGKERRTDILVTAIEVNFIGYGEYYGFEIDGDHLFMLGDFTVTHNTFTACEIIRGAVGKGGIVWWLVHRDELIQQASDDFTAQGVRCSTIRGGQVDNLHARVQVASIQTIVRRLDVLPAPTLIIFDEAHHCAAPSWETILERYPNVPRLGLTATPRRHDGKGLKPWFSIIVESPNEAELIAAGRLSPYRLLIGDGQFDGCGLKTMAGDYKKDELFKVLRSVKRTADMVQHYGDVVLPLRYRAIAFAVNIADSMELRDSFVAAGIRAAHVDGSMDKGDRRRLFDRFKAHDLDVLLNVALFGEGVHVDGVRCVIDGCPTQSLSVYKQRLGRAFKVHADGQPAVFLDHANNSFWRIDGRLVENHGFPDKPQTWTLEDTRRRSKGDEVKPVPVKICPKCQAAVPAAASKCICGHAFTPDTMPAKTAHGTLAEVNKDDLVDEAERQRLQAQVDEDKKRELGRAIWGAKSIDDLIAIGIRQGYKRPNQWAAHQWQRMQAKRSGKISAYDRA